MATVPVDGGRLWYDVTGEGQPLLFLHGGWLDGDAWRPQVARFADEYRVIRADLRGHGRTGPTEPRRYSVDLFADDVERLLAHLGVERPVLCGLSLGNLVVQTYLDRHPDGAAGAVLGGPVRSMPPVDVPAHLKPVSLPSAWIRASLSLAGSKATFRSLLGSVRSVRGGPWLSVSRETRARAVAAAGEMPPAEFRKVFGALYRYDPPDLAGVPVPTLAVYGRDEASAVKRQGRQVAAAVEDGAVAKVPDAAHLVNLDNPAGFNAAVAGFLADLPADEAR